MKKLIVKNIVTGIIVIISGLTNASGQSDTAISNDFESLSLKDLLNVKVVSVSKKAELLFEAPLSASVVTKEDIRRAGCTSIMEALRLVPGMIVREQTNGNYDIYLRGMDNVPPNALFEGSSTTTLVMIDGRPIYNYLKGGTFWETLPIDINDVEKIEVVKGPAAALYGPNAVSGVINFITRQTKKDGLYLVANSQQGSNHTFINNASVGFQSKKWSVIASGNYQHRDRTQASYYETYRNAWLEQPDYFVYGFGDTTTDIKTTYPYPNLAMEKYAGNVFLNYKPAEKIKINLTAGVQHSMVQRVSTDNGYGSLNTVASDNRYADLKAEVKGITAQFSYIKGTQVVDFQRQNKYDFNTFDANIEYNYTKGNLSLKPGLSYRSAIYDDTKYSDTLNKVGIFNARGQIITRSASLRGEYKLLHNKLRLVAGLAANTFNYPDATYLSYEFAATYKVNKKHLFRAVYSRSPRSSTVYENFVDQRILSFPIGVKKYMLLSLEGNRNLSLLTAKMFEIGYRGNIAPRLNIDVELFDIRSRNYTSLINLAPYVKLNGDDTVIVSPYVLTNLPITLKQQGITVSLTWSSSKLQVKPFITFQRSEIKNYAPFANTAEALPGPIQSNPAQNNIYSGMGTKATVKSTPAAFGGVSVNYVASSKINVNLNAYSYSSQTYYASANVIYNDGIRGIDHINAKMIVNANISYEAAKGLHFFCTGKNILNDRSREFFKTDDVPFMLLGGLNYEF